MLISYEMDEKIENVKKRLIRNLSKGYRQRVGFAQALVSTREKETE